MFANTFGPHQHVVCGLVFVPRPTEAYWRPVPPTYFPTRIRPVPIPLIAVDVKASVLHAVAEVELTQVYVNKETQPIEAVYYFPVDSNGGVTHFRAELEGRIIKGVVKPQEEAKAQYDQAVHEKRSAFLVESDKLDIFKVSVGYLKPGAQVKIVISYVTEVKNEKGSNALQFFIPTTVSPRYVPITDTDPKSWDLKNMTFSATTPAALTINVLVSLQGTFQSIQSPSHEINVSQGSVPEKPTWSRAVVNLTGRTSDMDRDFVLNIAPKEPHAPRLYQETQAMDNSTVIMAHFIPSFHLDEQKVELIFVLDRSGSMQGPSIVLAKKALQLFLHSLPMDCYFNVVGFGSSFQFLFPESVKYDDRTLHYALTQTQTMHANLGGTEILQPLREVFRRKPILDYLRQVFVITDGEVSNTEQVVGFINANAHVNRVFALGIGDSASHELVEGLAKAGGGTAAFATYNENIDKKLLQQLKNAIQPSLTHVTIDWEGLPPSQLPPLVEINKEKTLMGYGKPLNLATTPEAASPTRKTIQVPEMIPPIFDGSQLLVFGIFTSKIPTGVTITAESPDGPLSLKINLEDAEFGNGNGVTDIGKGMLHSLAAIKSIDELQLKIARSTYERQEPSSRLGFGDYRDGACTGADINILKDEVVKTSCKYGVMSKYTSFVAVEDTRDTNTSTSTQKTSEENWVMQTRYVPSQVSRGYGGGGGFPSFRFSGGPFLGGGGIVNQQMSHHHTSATFGSPATTSLFSSGAAKSFNFSGVSQSSPQSQGFPFGTQQSHCFSFSAPMSQPQQQHRKPQASFSLGAISSASPAASGFGLLSDYHFRPVSGQVDCSFVSSERTADNVWLPLDENITPTKVPKVTNGTMETTEESRLHLLISAQSYDGSFTLDHVFCSATGLILETLKNHVKINGWDEKSYATALALSYLEEKFANFRDSWELIALKARKWLQKNSGPALESMIIAAAQFIQFIFT